MTGRGKPLTAKSARQNLQLNGRESESCASVQFQFASVSLRTCVMELVEDESAPLLVAIHQQLTEVRAELREQRKRRDTVLRRLGAGGEEITTFL